MRIAFTQSRFDRVVVALSLLAPTALFGTLYAFGIRQNLTLSQPPGLYRMSNSAADPLVSFCPTGEASRVTSERGYRPESWACPDGHAPMLKPIAARAGDVVVVSHSGISVNGKLLPNTQSFPYDNRHNPLNRWPEGAYTVQPGTIWLLSTFNEKSFDSRYFGPVALADMAHHAHLVWAYPHFLWSLI